MAPLFLVVEPNPLNNEKSAANARDYGAWPDWAADLTEIIQLLFPLSVFYYSVNFAVSESEKSWISFFF